MVKPYNWSTRETKLLGREIATVTSQNHSVLINQQRNIEPERLYASSNLSDLTYVMSTWIPRV